MKYPIMIVYSTDADPSGIEDEALPFQILDYCRNSKELDECAETFGIRGINVEAAHFEIVKPDLSEDGNSFTLIHVIPYEDSILPAHAGLIETARIVDLLNE